jgi:hypothetical protein
LAVDDVLGAELADFMGDGRDNVAMEFPAFAKVFALESELVLLGHVAASSGADFVYDVK